MKYWAYVNNEILGPFEKDKLLQLPAFTPSLLICPQTPVGEKTEDWKEAATYPEISGGMSAGTLQSAPHAGGVDLPAASAAQPAAAQPVHDFKSLTPAPVEPVPPKESNLGGISLEVGHLERSGRTMPVQEQSRQSASSFDPISISSISRRADTLSGMEAPARSPEEGIAREPQPSFATAAPTPAPEPVQTSGINYSPQPSPAGAAPDNTALEELSRKLEALAQNSASRQDVASAADPLRMKLDQMGEVLSSMKNSQFQREIMDKLAYLESSLSDIKASMKDGSSAPMSMAAQMGAPSPTVFGAQAPAREEKSKSAAVNSKTTVIMDQGSKKSSLGAMFGSLVSGIGSIIKKLLKIIMTLVLLAAVALVAAIALKNAGVFDASAFIPPNINIPFLTAPAKKAEAASELPGEAVAQMAEMEGRQAGAQPEAKPAAPVAPDVSPEVIYFARYYTASPGGPKLEDKISEITIAAGGAYSAASWQAKKTGLNLYEAAAVIPVKGGNITFTYLVDYAKKTLLPADPTGKSAFDALNKTAPAKKAGRKSKKQGLKKAAAPEAKETAAAGGVKAQPKPAGAKAAAKPAAGTKKVTAPEEEFEYVYEEE